MYIIHSGPKGGCFVTVAGGVLPNSTLGTCSRSGTVAGGLQQPQGGPSCHGFALLKPGEGGLRLNAAKMVFNHATSGHWADVFPTAVAWLPW